MISLSQYNNPVGTDFLGILMVLLNPLEAFQQERYTKSDTTISFVYF
jgi:hypothetical protein